MTREEIEQAIENGESAWGLCCKTIEEIYFYKDNIYEFEQDHLMINKFWQYSMNNLFKTKAEAEHYLHHANITRTETLSFLTWEEFLEKKDIRFYTKDGDEVRLYITDDGNKIYVIEFKPYGYLGKWNATEANFYKAYDECVRLFRGEK